MKTQVLKTTLVVMMPVADFDNLSAIGSKIIELRYSVEALGGEVVKASTKTGLHEFKPAVPLAAPDSDEEPSGAGDTGKDETASDGVPVPVSGGKRKAAE